MVNGIGFYATEKIFLWLTAPDNSVKPYGYTFTGAGGTFSGYAYVPPGLVKGEPQEVTNSRATGQVGLWYVTAHGNSSDATGITNFLWEINYPHRKLVLILLQERARLRISARTPLAVISAPAPGPWTIRGFWS